MTKGILKDAFSTAIAPTLLDYAGSIDEASTPNGVSPDNHFWQTAHLARARLCHPSTPRPPPTRVCRRRRSGPCRSDDAPRDRQPRT